MKFFSFINSEKFKYLVAGVWNTLFGYSLGVGSYLLLGKHLHIIYISILTNIVAITMSFLTYKLFVFRTTGGWIKEYLKIYLVYGATAIIGTIMLWIFVDFFYINIWLSQGLVLALAFIFSFFLNRGFTFKRVKN
jgi:putative flippase GtrA